EPNGSSVCLPCEKDEYIEYPNDFSKCLGCQRCREDQVELSPCRATSNTQCACKSGTFCSPDHPCEMCQKCRPRCPQGEVELAPCTPHSDRQCGPPTGTVSGFSYNSIGIIVVGVVVLLVVLFCLWKCSGCCCPGELQGSPGPPGALRGYQRGRTEMEDNFQNERILVPVQGEDPVIRKCWGPGGVQDALGDELYGQNPFCPCSTLLSKVFPSPFLVLRRSFEFFARDVPYKDWKRYGRALDLLENDIVLAELNDKYSLEPFFQMLNTWHNRQGMNASVNTLLETLRRINLGGIAKDISSKLVQQGYFQYEVS
ncbi:TR10B factor, partial [Rynchops niger]|nr:TR10B factor [Rynchops niger]